VPGPRTAKVTLILAVEDWFAGDEGEAETVAQFEQVELLRTEMAEQRPRFDETLKQGEEIRYHCHPLAEQPMKHWLRILNSRWSDVSGQIEQKEMRLQEVLLIQIFFIAFSAIG
jgi:hypothetical protein